MDIYCNLFFISQVIMKIFESQTLNCTVCVPIITISHKHYEKYKYLYRRIIYKLYTSVRVWDFCRKPLTLTWHGYVKKGAPHIFTGQGWKLGIPPSPKLPTK